jgi:hypothetical protein
MESGAPPFLKVDAPPILVECVAKWFGSKPNLLAVFLIVVLIAS